MIDLAVIGLDTSHAVNFTSLMQGEKKMVEKLRVTKCMRFASDFFDESGQDERQTQMEEMGVRVGRSFEKTVAGVDGILLEINDPALHLEYFTKAAECGLPVFLDKPMADNLENAIQIYKIAQEKNIKVWSSSSLRFTPEIIECAQCVKKPILCNVFGPLGQAPKGRSLIWYGVHTFEMLMTLMGGGTKSVFAHEDDKGVVAVMNYKDGRRGVAECNYKMGFYGGRVQDYDNTRQYITAGSPYPHLIAAIEAFFVDGVISVPFENTLEIQAMMEAAALSLKSGKEEPVHII